MSLQSGKVDPFEDYRREKKMRALQRELHKRMESRQGQILRILEADERTEVLERQIQREMREFFEDSTRLAANVLDEISRQNALEISKRINLEMQEFFQEIIRRAESTLEGLSFRMAIEGGPQVAILEAPASREVPAASAARDAGEAAPPPASEESLLAAEPYVPEPGEDRAGPAADGPAPRGEEPEPGGPEGNRENLARLLDSLAREPNRLKAAITALYRAGLVTREEARQLFLDRQPAPPR